MAAGKRRGRKKKIDTDPTLQSRLIEYVSQGLTDEMAYSQAGISHETFYRYLNEIPEFREGITRARQQAHIMAVIAVRSALRQTETVDTESETFSETRLDKQGKPYEYTKSVKRQKVYQHPADWRAAVEWLKRRDRDNWSDKLTIDLDLKQLDALLALIKERGLEASEVFNAMIAELANVDRADGS